MARLLDILVNTATKRINEQQMPVLVLPLPLTKSTRDMVRRYKAALQTMKRLDAALKRRKIDIDSTGSLSVPYDLKRKHDAAWRQKRDARLQAIRTLRDQALLDLLGLEPLKQRAYLLRLKARLEAI